MEGQGLKEVAALPLSWGILTFSLEYTKASKLHGWILSKNTVQSFPNTEN